MNQRVTVLNRYDPLYSSEHADATVSIPRATSLQFARFDVMGSVGSAVTSEVLSNAGDYLTWSHAWSISEENASDGSQAEGSDVGLSSNGMEMIAVDSHHAYSTKCYSEGSYSSCNATA